jgi:hypothetical protein
MTHPTDENPSVYAQAIRRDQGKCRYCDRDILESFDTFSASHLDHLKPNKVGGPHDDPWNRVTSCGVCNNLKWTFDPSEGQMVTAETFDQCIQKAREYIGNKRDGKMDTSYSRDYKHWLKLLRGRDS